MAKVMANKRGAIPTYMVLLNFSLAIGFMAGMAYLVLTNKVQLTPSRVTELTLKDAKKRFEFFLNYNAPAVLMILLHIFNVIRFRVNTAARNPLSGNEVYTEAAKNILANTVEQFLLHVANMALLMINLDNNLLIKLVPLYSLYFFVGRLTFQLGYPLYRTFGFFVTFSPNVLATCFNFYKFLLFLEILV